MPNNHTDASVEKNQQKELFKLLLSDFDAGHLHLRMTNVAHKRLAFHGHNKSCQSKARPSIMNLFRSCTALTDSTFASFLWTVFGIYSWLVVQSLKKNYKINLEPGKQLNLLLISLLLISLVCLHFHLFFNGLSHEHVWHLWCTPVSPIPAGAAVPGPLPILGQEPLPGLRRARSAPHRQRPRPTWKPLLSSVICCVIKTQNSVFHCKRFQASEGKKKKVSSHRTSEKVVRVVSGLIFRALQSLWT